MRQTVRAIFVNRNNAFLLVQHNERELSDKDKWATVGGGLDEGESHSACLMRELSEEFGNSVASKMTIGPLLLSNEQPHRRDCFYVVWFDGDDVTVEAPDEILRHKWVSPKQAAQMQLFFGFEADLFAQTLKLIRPSR